MVHHGPSPGLGVNITQDEPSHIHIPRPSRVMRPGGEGTVAHRHLARLEDHIDAYPGPSMPLALEDLQAAANPR